MVSGSKYRVREENRHSRNNCGLGLGSKIEIREWSVSW